MLIQALILGLILSAAISVVGVLFAADLLEIFGAPEEVIIEGAAYLRYSLWGL